MDAWLDLQPAQQLQKPLRPSVGSWPPLTQGRLTPTTRRREHCVASWRELRRHGKRCRGAVGRDRSQVDDHPPERAPTESGTMGTLRSLIGPRGFDAREGVASPLSDCREATSVGLEPWSGTRTSEPDWLLDGVEFSLTIWCSAFTQYLRQPPITCDRRELIREERRRISFAEE